jgi:hypothetical protein
MRTLVLLLVSSATLFAADFWTAKKPEDWNEKEAKKMAASSPWAKTISGSMQGGAGALPSGGGRIRGGGSRGGGGGIASAEMGGMGGRGGGDDMGGGMGGGGGAMGGGMPTTKAVVRWESAVPVREAQKRLEVKSGLREEALKDFYVVSFTLLGRGMARGGEGAQKKGGGPQEARAALAQRIGQATRLEHKGKGIHKPEKLSVIDSPEGMTILFFFSRADALAEGDKEVTFATRVMAEQFQAKFNLKDMKFGGKLEL